MTKRPVPTIIEALDHEGLFAPHFRGDSWNAWRAFLAGLFALGMDDSAAAIYRACTGRASPPSAAFNEAAIVVGRRGGKSRVLALVATYLAVFRDYKPFLAPGEMATIVILAFNRSQARSIFRFVSGLFNAVPILKAMIVSETEEIITLSNRVVIEITAASFRSTRGYSFAAVLCDEVALWRLESESANPDTEILRALRPGMATIPGSILFLASSPYAKKGELYNSFQRHYAKDGARVLVWKSDTSTMNPGIDAATIAEAYDEDPVSARAEYGGEFRDDLADYVSIEVVDSVTDFGCFERPYDPDNVYAGFVDPTGGSNDSFTMAVAHRGADGVCILDALHEVIGPCDPVKAARECAALAGRYSITRLVSDRYGGQWPVQAFLECGLILEQSAKPKSDLYHDFLPLLNSAQVRLLEHRRLRSQLVNLERRVARSGRDSIDHPKGGRDDVVNSAAGVLVGLFLDRRPALVRQSDLLASGVAFPLPKFCQYIVAVMASNDKTGHVSIVYAAKMPFDPKYTWPKILILDFDAGPMRAGLFSAVAERVRDFAGQCRAVGGAVLMVPAVLAKHAAAAGVWATEIPSELKAEELLLSAANHAAAGNVKLCVPAAEKAKVAPFHGALDFRAGEGADDPLRGSLVLTISLALDQQ